jgi:hypothetical protein
MLMNLAGLPPELATKIVTEELASVGVSAVTAYPTSDMGVHACVVGVLMIGGEDNQTLNFVRHADAWEARSAAPVPGTVIRPLVSCFGRDVETERPDSGDWSKFESNRWTLRSMPALVRLIRLVRGDEERDAGFIENVGAADLVAAGLVEGFASSDAGLLVWRQEQATVTVFSWSDGTTMSVVNIGGEVLPVLKYADDGDEQSFFRPVSGWSDVEELTACLVSFWRQNGKPNQVRRMTGYLSGHCLNRPRAPFLSGHRLAVEMAKASPASATRAA